MLNFKINSSEIDKIGNFTKEEKNFRLKNLNYFNDNGFPNKKDEDWKFSDLKTIISKNFTKLDIQFAKSKKEKVDFIKDFEHNYIIITNGELSASDFRYEEKNKINLESFVNDNYSNEKENNPLINLNHALSNKGYYLEVKDNYKFKKILVIYYLFTEDLDENILNSKNKIKIGKNSELHLLDYFVNESKKNFFNNVHEDIILENSAILKNIYLQNSKSSGYFHKYSRNKLLTGSHYTSFIFPAGLKFNKLDLEFNLEGEKSECNLQSASFLDGKEHQEIKTRINHLSPNCKSHQKVKNVLGDRAIPFQGEKSFTIGNKSKSGDFAKAETVYKRILRHEPDHAEALHFLGLLSYQNGKNLEAIRYIEKAISLNPTSAIMANNLGLAFQAIGNVDAACSSYRQAIGLNPRLPSAYNNLANTLREIGDFEEAIANYRVAIKISPNYAKAYNNLLFTMLHSEKYNTNLYELFY